MVHERDSDGFVFGHGNRAAHCSSPQSAAVSTSASETMSKWELRDELVFEVDRQLSIAPRPAKAELVEIVDHTASSPFTAPAHMPVTSSGDTESADAPGDRELFDSDEEELNSMVVHEDQPQVNIVPAVNMDTKLSELIIRGQDIHVIPEESPSDEAVPPTPEAILTSETTAEPGLVAPAPDVLIANNLAGNVSAEATIVDTPPADAAEMKHTEFAAGYTSEPGPDAEVAKEASSIVDAVPVVFADVSAELVQGDLLNRIEATSAQPSTDAIEEDPRKVLPPATSPVSQPIDEAASEKPQEPEETSVDVAPPTVESRESDEAVSKQLDSLKLGSIQDTMKALSPSDIEEAKTEEAEPHSAAPLIRDSIRAAECLQDADSESDNELQEWELVNVEKPESAAQESAPAALETSSAAASVTAAGVAAAAGVIAAGVVSVAESKPAAAKAIPKVGVKGWKVTASTRMAGSATGKTSGTAAAAAVVSKAVPKGPAATRTSTAGKTTATTVVKGAPTRPAPSTTVKPAAAVSKAAAVKPSTATSRPASATRPAPTTTTSAKASAARSATSRVTNGSTSARPTAALASKPAAGAVKAPAAPKVTTTRIAVSKATVKPQPRGGIRAPPTKPAAAAATSTAAKKPPASSAAPAHVASRVVAARTALASRLASKAAPATGHGAATDSKKPTSTVASKYWASSSTSPRLRR